MALFIITNLSTKRSYGTSYYKWLKLVIRTPQVLRSLNVKNLPEHAPIFTVDVKEKDIPALYGINQAQWDIGN